MSGAPNTDEPSYISAHSADVILSDIRPIKLNADALRAINDLLDEFLSKILSTACSLATDRLRASLLGLLPTSLGKEALLEAEVELRAYWERTESKASLEDDSRTFNLTWAIGLLRLKCEAYSTLNEEDEDPASEARINEQFEKTHSYPPSVTLLDPAALYLTAILESMCEHILSNVGRVAARDSSRTSATVNDLYIALCEDDSIYGLFKTMKVYEQIELMVKTPKTRRSKSFSRSDRQSTSRTSSPQNDITLVNSTGPRSRQSSEGYTANPAPPSTAGSRTSFEKARAIRMFANGRGGEGETQNGHKKSESIKSESAKSYYNEDGSISPDSEMQREFDNLMRSTSTMKVSLTPDRLKTMEMYKQEKDRALRRPATHFSSNSEPDIPPSSRTNTQRPPLRNVDSIIEDEEEHTNLPKGRPRQASVAAPSSPTVPAVQTRLRSVSTSGALRSPTRKPPRVAPSSFALPPLPTSTTMQQSRDVRQYKAADKNGFPPRTRKIQRNRDSLDLDDVMNGSDDDQDEDAPASQPTRSPSTPRSAAAPHTVSAKTRELMDFLAEGPPEPPMSKSGRELVNFLAEGPPDYATSAISLDTSKPKGAGRLQRMISKLNLGNGEKTKGNSEGPKSPQVKQPPSSNRTGVISPKPSYGTLSSLANRPIPPRPPRPPRPISPPLSPHNSSDENKSVAPAHRPHQDANYSREGSSVDKSISEKPSPVGTPTRTDAKLISPLSTPNHSISHGNARNEFIPSAKEVLTDVRPLVPVRTTSVTPPVRKPVPTIVPTAGPSISEVDIRDMQRLLSSATTADECRLIFDMYMARNGIPREPKAPTAPYPSPSPSVAKQTLYTGGETPLEQSLVELFLGGSTAPERTSQPPSVQEPGIDGLPAENDTSDASISRIPTGVSIIQNRQVIPIQA
ncbi:hypothetical protein CPB84DRAFT_1721254 [Gymnopilus junonius]|uniref:Uncharacterized protein n=1 Tax=Gymnopilus junonius TaxID=109634 RepID=A0A9P5TVD4_GYMJU|nr:hypothetical protein CPB84DRAFT_1721254 [Gymnopilus junonius]